MGGCGTVRREILWGVKMLPARREDCRIAAKLWHEHEDYELLKNSKKEGALGLTVSRS